MKNSFKLSYLALVALMPAGLVFTGCRTMDRAGKDIERAGEKIQDNAK